VSLIPHLTDAQLASAIGAAPLLALAAVGLLLETVRIYRTERAAARVRNAARTR
jgi:hypothetical protein